MLRDRGDADEERERANDADLDHEVVIVTHQTGSGVLQDFVMQEPRQ
jgi:hypothetical protein